MGMQPSFTSYNGVPISSQGDFDKVRNPYLPNGQSYSNADPNSQFWASYGSDNGQYPTGNLPIPTPPSGPNYFDKDGNLNKQYSVAQPGGVASNVSTNSNLDELNNRLNGITQDTSGVDALKSRALQQGPSAWAQLATQQQQQGEAALSGQAAGRTAGSYAGAEADLAANGGESAGAGERLARDRARDTAGVQQGVAQEGARARTGIGIADQQQKDQFLQQLPGAQIQALQPQFQKQSAWQSMANDEQARGINLGLANQAAKTGVDTGNANRSMGGEQQQNAFNLGQWQSMMGAWGADKTGNAIMNSGKK